MVTMPSIESLPKWAQEKIVSLERSLATQVRHLQDQLDVVSGVATKETKITFRYWDPNDKVRPIPDGSTVSFKMAQGDIRISLEDGHLVINGDNVIAIYPRAANTVYIDEE